MWLKYRSHIVYQAVQYGPVYDVCGVFIDYSDDELIPISVLSREELDLFRYTPQSFRLSNEKVHKTNLNTQCRVNDYEKLHGMRITKFI